MSDHDDLKAADIKEIENLADRVTAKIGRRRFVSGAAKAIAFTVPASMMTGIPTDALAAGSPRRKTKKKAKRKTAKRKTKKKAIRKVARRPA